jgi:hypothetical protein
LRNGGFYWAASEYWDLRLAGDIFSKGGYRAEAAMNYKVRYKLEGAFTLQHALQSTNERNDPNYTADRSFFITWTHNQPISTTASLRANVQAGASNFLRRNSFDVQQNLQNNLQSSISFNKSIPRYGWRFTANLDHRQELSRRFVTLGLPSLTINKDRMFPFKRKESTKRSWYDDLGITYNADFQNRLAVPDSILFSQGIVDSMRYGMRHAITANTNIKLLKYITLTPALNYNELWYMQTVNKEYQYREWDTVVTIRDSIKIDTTFSQSNVITQRINGFEAARFFNFNLNANTILYGVKSFSGVRQRAIRHQLRPGIGYSYQPDFSDSAFGYYRTVQVNQQGDRASYSRFEQGIFGGPPVGTQQAINFSLSNVVEMKYIPLNAKPDTSQKENKETKSKYKYLTLVDNLGLNGSYNFAADSMRLSNIAINARNNILNNKVNINLNAQLDPYILYEQIDTTTERISYRRINRYAFQEGRGLGRITNASFAFTFALKSKDVKNKNAVLDSLSGSYSSPFHIPWTFNLTYSLNYAKPQQQETLVHSLNFNGTLKLTPKWDVRFNSNFDFRARRFGLTSIDITRDLHCWQAVFNVIPFGPFTRYLLTINVKASSLQDLKITKRREWQDRFTNRPSNF